MRIIKFSRRSLLRGLGAGPCCCPGMSRTLYAQEGPRPARAAFFFYANGSHPDWAPTGNGRRLRADAAPGADGAHPQGHHHLPRT